MSFSSMGLDFLGGGMEGAAQGAILAGGLKMAGYAVSPWAAATMALGFGGGRALGNVLAGLSDSPAEKMQMRLGSQQIEMNDLNLEAEKAKQRETRKQMRQRQFIGARMGQIFKAYQAQGATV